MLFKVIAKILVIVGFLHAYTSYSAKIDQPKVQKEKPKVERKIETATMAGGCFWGVEELLRKLKGVVETEVGYTGGDLNNPTYKDVKLGTTGHAEAVQVKFDPSQITYEDILAYFFRLHDPTQVNGQGNDIGTQYRSVIFYHDLKQKEIAEKVKQKVDKSGKWKKPVVTQIIEFKKFYAAEDYHQDYLQKNPDGYTCHYLRD
jgi:methionine-S-sulfoxide reductase